MHRKKIVLAKYRFCSLCGHRLRAHSDGTLRCTSCSFVNYRNARPTATCLVLYRNKLLLTRRKGRPFKGWWDLPGGFIDHGDTPEDTAKRELLEETGLHISIERLFGIYPGTYPLKTDPFMVLSIAYLARSTVGKLEALDDVSESRWFAKREIPKHIAFDSNKKIIKDFLRIWN